MVYTVTLNPAIDYIMHIGKLVRGSTNRSEREEIYFGGKGINVSAVLSELGIRSTALGFIGGFTGEALAAAVRAKGIDADFIRLNGGCTRINIKLKSGAETEINAKGPDIGSGDVDILMNKLDRLNDGDVLVLAGSVPGSVPCDIYERILERVSPRGVRTVVDAEGELLRRVLKFGPYLIKPNRAELAGLISSPVDTEDEVIRGAMKLCDMGARNVLVSLGGDGAILIDETGGIHVRSAHHGRLVNSVGAGDSMVAGFIAGMAMRGDFEYALELGSAAGSATAFSAGLADKKTIMALMPKT